MTLSLIWLHTKFDITELRFPWGICNGCGMPTGDAYSSGHLVPSLLGLAYVLLVETNPFFRTFRYFSGLCSSNIPRCFLDFAFKRDDFNFHITNFQILSSNIPSLPAYGVFISQLIRHAIACSTYKWMFYSRAAWLSNKAFRAGICKGTFEIVCKEVLWSERGSYQTTRGPLSRMLHDILDDDNIKSHPPLIRHYTNFWPCYWSGPYYRIWLFTLLHEVSIEHLQRVRHANRGRLLLRTPGPVPLWDLHVF